jgi:hypothetical protein
MYCSSKNSFVLRYLFLNHTTIAVIRLAWYPYKETKTRRLKMIFDYAERMLIVEGLKLMPLGVALELYQTFVELDEEDLDYTVSLDDKQIDIVIASLGELPAKMSFKMLCKFEDYIHKQGAEHAVKEERTPEGSYEAGFQEPRRISGNNDGEDSRQETIREGNQ